MLLKISPLEIEPMFRLRPTAERRSEEVGLAFWVKTGVQGVTRVLDPS